MFEHFKFKLKNKDYNNRIKIQLSLSFVSLALSYLWLVYGFIPIVKGVKSLQDNNIVQPSSELAALLFALTGFYFTLFVLPNTIVIPIAKRLHWIKSNKPTLPKGWKK